MISKPPESDILNFLEMILWDPNGKPVDHASLTNKKKDTALYLLSLGYIESHKSDKNVFYSITNQGMNLFVNLNMLKYTKRLNCYTLILIIVGVITIIATIINIFVALY